MHSTAIEAEVRWESLDDDLQEILTARVAEMWPGTDPADFWRRMDPENRDHWIYNERHGTPITKTWEQDEARITAEADAATGAELDAIPIVGASADAEDTEPALLRRWTMAELAAEPDDFAWLVKRLLAEPTYGPIAGEMKTLKSYILGFLSVGVASGLPIFDTFTPQAPRPVVVYVGEGGRKLWHRRIRRICAAMGATPGDLDLHPVFDVAPISSLTFQESLRRDLDEIQPGLVGMDPLYTYHGTAARASDLHQEGALLNQLSRPCMDAGASLQVVNHMNQTGTGMSLKRITMAGSGEWADSWLLLADREPPAVDAGSFKLTLEVGSRQWGGMTWELDLEIGRFDEDTGTHDGEIAWDIRRGSTVAAEGKATASRDKAESRILDTLADDPWEFTKSQVKTTVGGNKDAFEDAFGSLAQRAVIGHSEQGRTEAGTTKKRLLWGIAETRAKQSGPGWSDDAF